MNQNLTETTCPLGLRVFSRNENHPGDHPRRSIAGPGKPQFAELPVWSWDPGVMGPNVGISSA